MDFWSELARNCRVDAPSDAAGQAAGYTVFHPLLK